MQAYLKALLSTGFVVPKKNIFLSIGGYHVSSRPPRIAMQAKTEMLRSVHTLQSLGFELYASKGTADYFQSNNIAIRAVDWPFEEGESDQKTSSGSRFLLRFSEDVSDRWRSSLRTKTSTW